MKLTGERQIPADQATVWQALNDAEVLLTCIPGCQEIEWISDTEMAATVKAKVGPVNATFKGVVELSDVDAPNSYVISGQGKGGAAGFAKGKANVQLITNDEGTLLTYQVTASVGGKLAQVGSRLIQGTATKLAGQFFDAISAHLGGATEADAISGGAANPIDDPDDGLPPLVWGIGLGVLLALSLWYYY